ncbi:claudin-9-like isoform X2 [Melanotaenia boesemani]|uniref:claudin-9-like isoform X2 n=1 Tax=Melanotaenia boesemani TaxID=1250792 RepID=UPI001C044C6E|nr:claudin-9-like isoform X2 [Melanotaenia boesemani]
MANFPPLAQYGLWKFCMVLLNERLECVNFEVPPILASTYHATKAMTVISCLLTCLSLLILLIQHFGASCIPYLQNEDAKPKIYLVVGVGLLLAGLLVIISAISLPHALEQFLKSNLEGGRKSFVLVKGSCVYVGWMAGLLLLLDGGLLCFFRKKTTQIGSVNITLCRFF